MDIKKLSFLTTHKNDYVKKPIRYVKTTARKQEFTDPVNEGFRNYLSVNEENISPPNEDGELYLEKFKEKYKDLGRIHFKDPINKEMIVRNKITKGLVTEYQTKYCDIEKDIQYYIEQRNRNQVLSEDTNIPLTTYANVYRNPSVYHGETMEKPLVIIPPNSLSTSGAVVIRTISDYNGTIGRLGGFIVENMYEQVQAAKMRKFEK